MGGGFCDMEKCSLLNYLTIGWTFIERNFGCKDNSDIGNMVIRTNSQFAWFMMR